MGYEPGASPYTAASRESFAYETTVVDAMYRRCHELSHEGASAAVVDEGKSIIEAVSKLKYDLTHDRALEQLGAPAHGAPPTAPYDEIIRAQQPTWFKSAWLFTECYLYRRLRLLYERSTHWQRHDPFHYIKEASFLASGTAVYACAATIEGLLARVPLSSAADDRSKMVFLQMVSASLWGNATDLSLLTDVKYEDLQKLQAGSSEQVDAKAHHILVNDALRAWDSVRKVRNGRVDIVLDNAGFELVTDLVLGDWLLTLRGAYAHATPERTAVLRERIGGVRARIAAASVKSGRTKEPHLLAVSKLHPPSDIAGAMEATGQRHFGENYVQELVEKAAVLPADVQWHLVGGLQSNKAKLLAAVPNLYAVESVDSEKLAAGLEKALARPENAARRRAPLLVYVQVNTSGEPGKSGVLPPPDGTSDSAQPAAAVALAQFIILHCPHMRLQGLMTIGALANSRGAAQGHELHNPDFAALVAARAKLVAALRSDPAFLSELAKAQWWTPHGPTTDAYEGLRCERLAEGGLALSMGMSEDLEAAVTYGSDQVRIGSDCFGPRAPNSDAAEVRAQECRALSAMPLVRQVVFHTKNMPWFVSDACVKDVQYTLDKLQDPALFQGEPGVATNEPIRAMAARWQNHFAEGRFAFVSSANVSLGESTGPLNDFWTYPYSYGYMPERAPALVRYLEASGLVIFKGDLNYRKLTQDVQWEPTTPFATALGPLCGALDLLVLRTCKAEVIAGLPQDCAQTVGEADATWRTDGHWAVASGAPAGSASVDPTAARHEQAQTIRVQSDNLAYGPDHITAHYEYQNTHVERKMGASGAEELLATPYKDEFEFRTERRVPKTGMMLVGLGGNNGTTITATVLANRENIQWHNKDGLQTPNYYGSLVRASTMRLGTDPVTGKDVWVPFSNVLPMVHPNDFVIGGWDISGLPMDKSMERAKVLDYDLQRQVAPLMADIKPLPSVYYPDFIAANQEDRADNVIPGESKSAHVEQLRKDIRAFKSAHGLEQVIVVWTANTERYSTLIPGVNDTADNLLRAVEQNHEEVSPSTIFAIACILENAPYINGAPQNTFVPGAIDLAEKHKAFIGGDDLKTGQTKVKSVLAEYLVNAGIKPLSIASYNHLGNNDGHNLSSQRQFRSKEISKSSVVDDCCDANHLLYRPGQPATKGAEAVKGERPDHCIVIKYVPAVGDQKVAMDDYTSELCMGGRNRLYVTNLCEDSLLASPLLIDLAILAELMTRINYRVPGEQDQSWKSMYSVLSLLSYSLKAPIVKPGSDVVNSLNRQRAAVTNFLRACLSLAPESDLLLETRLW
ncbi:inositol-3-phosphate synthase [Malassezia sp. CBS 17886]|nr:inositol-3-phosphate synthase [Malassezia sp. CBS 17886]